MNIEKRIERRNRKIAKLRMAGMTYQEIGEFYGLTRQGVHRVLKEYYPELTGRGDLAARNERIRARRREGTMYRDLVREFDLSVTRLRQIINREQGER